jgi:hypothetical protein
MGEIVQPPEHKPRYTLLIYHGCEYPRPIAMQCNFESFLYPTEGLNGDNIYEFKLHA